MLDDGEQHRRVLERLQRVPAVRHDQQIAGCAVPGRLARAEPDPAVQDVDGGLAGVLVLAEHPAGGQRDHRLAELVLVSAVDGGAAAAAG
ncbi:hypothetical protein V2I01_26325 [Micromonospora sp. BRA006-A]|nr:hypothetical protein [Micromonospora sp. BRA006-A]